MQQVQTDFPIGTVIVPSSSLTRFAAFWMSLESVKVPIGTHLIVQMGADIPYQLNEGIRGMIGDWIWILGDDHTFDPDVLMKLLAREKDVIMPIVPRRDPPFKPVLIHGPLRPNMQLYNWADLPSSGLFQLPKGDPAGQACMLVRRKVLGRLGDPWFEGGKLIPGRLMEDMYFVKRLHDLDIPIWIDCDLVVGHIANITILPYNHKGKWYASYRDKGKPILWDDPVELEKPIQIETKPLCDPQLFTTSRFVNTEKSWEEIVNEQP